MLRTKSGRRFARIYSGSLLDPFSPLKPNIALTEHEVVGDTGGGKQIYKGVSAHTLIANSHHNMC